MSTRYDELIAGLRDAAQPDRHARREACMIVRLADSLGWDVPEFEEFHARADKMLSGDYVLR